MTSKFKQSKNSSLKVSNLLFSLRVISDFLTCPLGLGQSTGNDVKHQITVVYNSNELSVDKALFERESISIDDTAQLA